VYRKNTQSVFLDFICPSLSEGTSNEIGDTRCEDPARSKIPLLHIKKKEETNLSKIHSQLLRNAQCVQKTEPIPLTRNEVSAGAGAMPLPQS
jgi:hypothetical protein